MTDYYWVVRYKKGSRGGNSQALPICITLKPTRTCSIMTCMHGFDESWKVLKERLGLEVVKVRLVADEDKQ